jgi:2-methylisocitrate lyase-like PEP mutase family enzyme
MPDMSMRDGQELDEAVERALGVARVSFGPGPQGAAMAALRRIGTDLLAGGDVDETLAFRPPM